MDQQERHVIWSNTYEAIKAIADDSSVEMKDEYPEFDENDWYNYAVDTNNMYYDDEIMNLKDAVNHEKGILIFGRAGRWDGTYDIRPHCIGSGIADILSSVSHLDEKTFYVDNEGELRVEGSHHDF